MFLHKTHIDNYIRCPYYFAINVLSKLEVDKINNKVLVGALNKASLSKSSRTIDKDVNDKDISWIKNAITKIAIQEMKLQAKTTMQEYRIMYTNKFYKSLLNNITATESKSLIDKLNSMFSVFSENAFIAYNLPVEIPVTKTNVIFRDVIDFILSDPDDENHIIVVEFDLFREKNKINIPKYYEWLHYKIQYAYLASLFNKNVTVNIIDPFLPEAKIEIKYTKDSFDELYKDFAAAVNQIVNKDFGTVLYRNLYNCSGCEIKSACMDANF